MKGTKGNHYLSLVLNSIPRLLSLQNRCLVDPSYGCFDKKFWHFKTSDFPNSTAQMGSEALARLWSWRIENNPYYDNPMICQWAKNGFLYLVKIQKKDGSFDEWYPNERGWAGPTGYVLHSLASGYNILHKKWDPDDHIKIKKAIYKAAYYLKKREEKHVLCNHFAVALMALYDSWEILRDEWILKAYNNLWVKFKRYICDEGWTLEYDGVDLGYNLATLSFLGRIHSKTKNKQIENYCKKSIKFLSYFCFPDKSFGGRIGSRSTSHIYPFALEYWSETSPMAKSMAISLQDSSLFPDIQDDHYLVYRLCDYIEAGQIAKANEEASNTLPFNQKGNQIKYFPLAGLYIRKTTQYYFVCNFRRGGAYVLYRLHDKRLIDANSGVIGQEKKGSPVLSSQSSYIKWEIQTHENKCYTKGPLVKVRNQNFNPQTFLLFRLFLLIGGNIGLLSYWIKIIIRKLLIVGEPIIKKTSFERTFFFKEDEIIIEDILKGIDGHFYTGFDFSARYVPQSRYFQNHELWIRPKKMNKVKNRLQLKHHWKF